MKYLFFKFVYRKCGENTLERAYQPKITHSTIAKVFVIRKRSVSVIFYIYFFICAFRRIALQYFRGRHLNL